ncbi:MAG: hypothetical protein IKK29_04435, partial [Christensenellaceae bacterium]|nr:hypothetical protein [Christensenellaceae bacterium]
LLLIVRLMVPVTVESGFHFWHEPAVTAREIAEETVRRAERAEAIRQAEAAEVSVPQSASQKQNAAPKAPAKVSTENVPVQAEKKPAIHITWQHIVLAVWTMGMIAFGGFFVRARIRFLRKIVLQAPTEEMYREYERICGEMRLCRVPELVVCEIASPALMGRRILLPEGLSGQALRYALYHEMTHYRRKDHIMVVLMSALRCVYWFNPLVWAAFKAMQEDMEVACDAGVLQLIGTEEKGGYLMTLLKMFSSHTTPAIGMAQAESKRAAKARIEGAFRKHRTGRMMRMVSAVVACMILVCCFTTACQPTPEVSPLQGKGQLQEKIEESEEVKVYEETEPKLQYSEEFEGGNKYEINAEVIGQDVENIPIYDIEFVPFEDGEVLQARLEAAFPDYVLGADYLTKEFYTKKLEEYQKYLARFENGQHPITGEPLAEGEAEEWIPQIPIAKEYEYMWVVNEETNETLGDPPLADNLKALLKETMAKLEKAPSAEEIGTSFVFEDHDGAEVVSVTATSEKETLDLCSKTAAEI